MRSTMAAAAPATRAAPTRSLCRTRNTTSPLPSHCRRSPCSSSSLNKSREKIRTAPPRVVVESVRPQVDGGRYPIKRAIGDEVLVEADVFTDGHDAVVVELLFKREGEKDWRIAPMEFRHNDHWAASFRVEKLGRYQYTVRGWTDPFVTWQRDLVKRHAAKQDLAIDLKIGAQLIGRDIPDYETAMAL